MFNSSGDGLSLTFKHFSNHDSCCVHGHMAVACFVTAVSDEQKGRYKVGSCFPITQWHTNWLIMCWARGLPLKVMLSNTTLLPILVDFLPGQEAHWCIMEALVFTTLFFMCLDSRFGIHHFSTTLIQFWLKPFKTGRITVRFQIT